MRSWKTWPSCLIRSCTYVFLVFGSRENASLRTRRRSQHNTRRGVGWISALLLGMVTPPGRTEQRTRAQCATPGSMLEVAGWESRVGDSPERRDRAPELVLLKLRAVEVLIG